MKKIMSAFATLGVVATVGYASNQCPVLSDAEFTKMFSDQSITFTFSEVCINASIYFNKNGALEVTDRYYENGKKTMTVHSNGTWSIKNATMYIHFTQCRHDDAHNPNKNEGFDKICYLNLNEGDEALPINPCSPLNIFDRPALRNEVTTHSEMLGLAKRRKV